VSPKGKSQVSSLGSKSRPQDVKFQVDGGVEIEDKAMAGNGGLGLPLLAVLVAGFWVSPVHGFEFKVISLVQAAAGDWREIPADAVIDKGRLSFKKKVFLESRKSMPVWSPTVKRAVAEAMKGLGRAERRRTRTVLDAVQAWAEESLEEDDAPLGCPGSWRTAAGVMKDGRGNSFEIARTLATMLRVAGIPARPTFNGVPLLYVYITPPGKKGFWTVWDPRHPSGSFLKLPVLWLPLRAGDVELVETEPEVLACAPLIEGRRFPSRESAAAAFAAAKESGSFSGGGPEPIRAEASGWWEVWIIGARMGEGSGGAFSATVPLPFVQDRGYGVREHAVWSSAPERVRQVARPDAQTDQLLGGLLLKLTVHFSAAAS